MEALYFSTAFWFEIEIRTDDDIETISAVLDFVRGIY